MSTRAPSRRSAALVLVAAFTLFTAGAAHAFPVFDTFGPLDQATFGGQGIPNQEVAVSKQFTFGSTPGEITVAMSATQRFSNPALTNDDAGTYFATTGSNFGGKNESTFEGALWNWNFYIDVADLSGGTNVPALTDYDITIYYDFDPGLDTPLTDLGSINLTQAILADPMIPNDTTLIEDSQNLLFSFLENPIPGIVTPPAGSFDPNAVGEYNFAVTVSQAGFPVETVAMDVQVQLPEPGTLGLVLLGLGAAAGVRRPRGR